ncbi:zinc-binding dehydrogenase [Phyllosticta capitalensis]|uniref:zinc-binding dehydrogenase n=1 Tax=Phyllosticta capitalensis TaxID=121624 RepID=UPI00312DEEB4
MSLSYQHHVALKHEKSDNPRFEIQNVPLPDLGPNDVLVQLAVTGICGTDFALATGKLGPTRRILGHEGIGRVVALGSSLNKDDIPIGQRVGIAWIRDVCGRCQICLHANGSENPRCLRQLHSGRKFDGTFAQYTIAPARYLMPVPEGLPDEVLAPILCGGITSYKALKNTGATPGAFIAISGAGGGVGALSIQYAKAMGYRVIAVDAGEPKRQFCLDLGAEAYVNVASERDAAGAVKAATQGKGAAAVLVTAGSGAAYNASLNMLAPFGTLVCIGIPPPDQLMSFHPLQFIDFGYRIIGSCTGTQTDLLEAIEFVERGLVKPKTLLAKLDDLNRICRETAQGKVTGKYVIKL